MKTRTIKSEVVNGSNISQSPREFWIETRLVAVFITAADRVGPFAPMVFPFAPMVPKPGFPHLILTTVVKCGGE
jgi:hypothetical protein